MLLGFLGAALASQYSDSRDAPIAIAVATQAMNQQSMINFTRAHEYEADRVGIDTLNQSNFNPEGMATFFEKLMRENPVDQRYKQPEYLRTHPLSINRVTEAKNRAKAVEQKDYHESELYAFVKERIRLVSKNIEIDNASYYKELFKAKEKSKITNAEIYGYALTLHHSHENIEALKRLQSIKKSDETSLVIAILEANIWSELDFKKGQELFEKLYKFYPDSPKVIVPFIQMLSQTKKYKYRKQARTLARRLVQLYPDKPNYYQVLAIANQNLGKSIEANEALAMKEHFISNNYKAVRILKNILKDDLDYYQRARIESKITKYENLITDNERSREVQEEKTGRTRH